MSVRIACVLAVCAAGLAAQTPPVTILEIEYDNLVWHYGDSPEFDKHASSPLPVPMPATLNRLFKTQLGLADVVAVNGKPAKGLQVNRNIPCLFSTTLLSGQVRLSQTSTGGV